MTRSEHSSGETTRAVARTAAGQSLDRLYRAVLGSGRRVSLLIYHRDGAELVPLPPGRPLVVGRSPEADLTIRDGSLSRRHARFELVEGEVWLEDLGSTNGTRVNGEPLGRGQVGPIDQIYLGTLPVVLNTLDPLEEGFYGLEGHDRLCAAAAAEVARARAFGRRLALLMVNAGAEGAGSLHHWCPDIRRLLRPFDLMGLYGPGLVELLVPETSAEEVRQLGQLIVKVGRAGSLPLRVGAALFPDSAGSVEQLLEAARVALERTTAEAAVGLAPAPGRVRTAAAGSAEGPWVLRSERMQEAFSLARRVAPSGLPVLVQGETGTGKEVLAQVIHEHSGRQGGQLCCVNCGGLPEQLVESTLFGHERGAFTGADRQAQGVFETARCGTVLLDEVGELPPGAQASLLRVLESGRFCRVGATREIEVDVRVLAATNCDLEQMVAGGRFRKDLLYRLNAVTVRLPPLRERPEEVLPLAQMFVEQANARNARQVVAIETEALKLLQAYAWPGNVRELRNVVERGVVIAEGDTLTVDDLPDGLRRVAATGAALAEDRQQPAASLKELVQQYEAHQIQQALERTDSDRRASAELLGVPLRTLAYKMNQYGIRIREG